MHLNIFFFSILVFLFSLFFTLNTTAQGDSFYQLLEILRNKGTLSEEEYNSLLKASKEISDPSQTNERKEKGLVSKADNEWSQKIKIKGDIRIRYQYNHLEDRNVLGIDSPDSRHRGRLRGKIGVVGKPLLGWETGIGLTSGSSNPRGSNVDLGDTFSTKNILLDYAYIENKRKKTSWIAGKFSREKYLWNATDLMWDSDINPEGISTSYADIHPLGSYWTNVGLWVLEEVQNSSEDPYLIYLQLGKSFEWKTSQLKFAGTKYFFVDMNESQVFQAFEHSSGTNRDNNLNAFQLSGEFSFRRGSQQFGLITDLVKNVETNSNESFAYSAGFQVIRPPWKFKYIYSKLEHDSIPDFLPDSDRFNGHTGVKGHEAELQYRLNKKLRLGLDFYSSKDYETNVNQHILQADILLNF